MKITKKQFLIGSLIAAGIVGVILYSRSNKEDTDDNKSDAESVSSESKSRRINFTR